MIIWIFVELIQFFVRSDIKQNVSVRLKTTDLMNHSKTFDPRFWAQHIINLGKDPFVAQFGKDSILALLEKFTDLKGHALEICDEWVVVKVWVLNSGIDFKKINLGDLMKILVSAYHCGTLKLKTAKILRLLGKILAASPHSMLVERFIAVHTSIQSDQRLSLGVRAFNDGMFIKLSMGPTATTDLRPAAIKWMSDANRRPQRKWNLDKYKQQRFLSNFFDQSDAIVDEQKASEEDQSVQREPLAGPFSVYNAWDNSD